MKIARERVALFHYTLKNDDGEILDSSEGEAPMSRSHAPAWECIPLTTID